MNESAAKFKKACFLFPVAQFAIIVAAIALLVTPAAAQKDAEAKQEKNVRTILVTAVAHNNRTRAIAMKLQPSDFAVKENNVPQEIIRVTKGSTQPVVLAVLIQDNLIGRVNNELDEIRDFIKGLPEGSTVMTAYITSGALNVKTEFTTDTERAADSLRILMSSDIATPYSPFIQVEEAVEMFRDQPVGRRLALVISNGLDDTFGLRRASPFFSAYLGGAVYEAQREGVAVYTIYAPATGRFNRRALNTGQGALLRLSDETGGESFFSGSDFVTFSPYFREFGEILSNQWLITYKSTSKTGKFRKIEVTTDFDISLQYQAGYNTK